MGYESIFPHNQFTYEQLWEKVINEFQMAYDALPETVTDSGGRANKIAAASYLASLRMERRLEMAMESSRYFDLRRWGIASTTLNSYFKKAKNSSYDATAYGKYYESAHYTACKNEFYPVPYNQLYYIPGLYVQNKGY